ncbi:S-adenosylmethionine synthase 1 [Olea europaea subsp. europaea]|uniref:S-adenosylmethionine synthase 1 n=1 Tax=Olea europaea subsp. europaea TaxID=158383 RepID=A0A8S0SXM5_OLEEU|nr:S-adenosylmethionine synthase 1 [Olea europaea subsp. europaea]
MEQGNCGNGCYISGPEKGRQLQYQKNARYCRFGRDNPDFTWENIKALKAAK